LKEVWKSTIWSSDYQVSNTGRLRSNKCGSWKVLKGGKNNRGYHQVAISVNGKTMSKLRHRLVAESFIPNPQNLETVNHIDGDKGNNTIENLEWMRNGDNLRHGHESGIRTGKRGEACNFTKINEFKALTIHTILRHWSQREIATHYKLRQANISCIKHGKSWRWMNLHGMHTNKSTENINEN